LFALLFSALSQFFDSNHVSSVYADKLPATAKTIDDHGSTFTTGTGEHVRLFVALLMFATRLFQPSVE
jgi:hypothetical protein